MFRYITGSVPIKPIQFDQVDKTLTDPGVDLMFCFALVCFAPHSWNAV